MENWFKISLLIIGTALLFILGYSQYLQTRQHNLEVVNSIRLCASDSLNESGVKNCSRAVGEEYIFKDLFEKTD